MGKKCEYKKDFKFYINNKKIDVYNVDGKVFVYMYNIPIKYLTTPLEKIHSLYLEDYIEEKLK